MKLEEALILEEIGDVFPRGQKQWKPWHPPNQTSTFAQEIDYWLEYVPKDIHGSGITGDAPITVTVEKFANEAWPLYFAKWSPSPDLLPEQNRDLFLTRVSKFDNRVVMDRQFRLPDDTGKLWFFWPSGKNLISVIDSSKEIHEEILRRYLEKYPSSLR